MESKINKKVNDVDIEYYYVPMWSPIVKYNDSSLNNILSSIDTDLAREEVVRYEMNFGDTALKGFTDSMLNFVSEYQKKISAKYTERRLPENLILKQDINGLREFATDKPLEAPDIYLSVKRITSDEVAEILKNNPNYYEYAWRLFYLYDKCEFSNEKNSQEETKVFEKKKWKICKLLF